jgi:hypothetical protein
MLVAALVDAQHTRRVSLRISEELTQHSLKLIDLITHDQRYLYVVTSYFPVTSARWLMKSGSIIALVCSYHS